MSVLPSQPVSRTLAGNEPAVIIDPRPAPSMGSASADRTRDFSLHTTVPSVTMPTRALDVRAPGIFTVTVSLPSKAASLLTVRQRSPEARTCTITPSARAASAAGYSTEMVASLPFTETSGATGRSIATCRFPDSVSVDQAEPMPAWSRQPSGSPGDAGTLEDQFSDMSVSTGPGSVRDSHDHDAWPVTIDTETPAAAVTGPPPWPGGATVNSPAGDHSRPCARTSTA